MAISPASMRTVKEPGSSNQGGLLGWVGSRAPRRCRTSSTSSGSMRKLTPLISVPTSPRPCACEAGLRAGRGTVKISSRHQEQRTPFRIAPLPLMRPRSGLEGSSAPDRLYNRETRGDRNAQETLATYGPDRHDPALVPGAGGPGGGEYRRRAATADPGDGGCDRRGESGSLG